MWDAIMVGYVVARKTTKYPAWFCQDTSLLLSENLNMNPEIPMLGCKYQDT
jgi:hypothetical protein